MSVWEAYAAAHDRIRGLIQSYKLVDARSQRKVETALKKLAFSLVVMTVTPLGREPT